MLTQLVVKFLECFLHISDVLYLKSCATLTFSASFRFLNNLSFLRLSLASRSVHPRVSCLVRTQDAMQETSPFYLVSCCLNSSWLGRHSCVYAVLLLGSCTQIPPIFCSCFTFCFRLPRSLNTLPYSFQPCLCRPKRLHWAWAHGARRAHFSVLWAHSSFNLAWSLFHDVPVSATCICASTILWTLTVASF